MGAGSSDLDREAQAEAYWLVPHRGLNSPWTQFALRRYGSGFAATGVASNVALPRLVRRRLQDWTVRGCSVYLGPDYVSYGRDLGSLSRADARLFYGIDVRFGKHERTNWLWYCRAHEWLLRLHKADLEPLPVLPDPATFGAPVSDQRWPGRPRYLHEEAVTEPSSSNGAQPPKCNSAASNAEESGAGAAAVADASSAADAQPEAGCTTGCTTESPMAVEHQLSLLLSNAEGHVGHLCLPVPRSKTDAVAAMVQHWAEHCVPLTWSGRRWVTAEDFALLRETSLNMTDLFLMGLETEVAMALTPDWTWEKYPQGFGEVALASDDGDSDDAGQRLDDPLVEHEDRHDDEAVVHVASHPPAHEAPAAELQPSVAG